MILAAGIWMGLAASARAADTVYWSINPSGLPIASPIAFSNLDGSGAGGSLTPGVTGNQPFGVAIDIGAGRVYWVNRAVNTISYANLDGSGGGDLSAAGATVNHPIGLTIDPAAGRIYWGNEGDNAHPISWANLDGSGGGSLGTTGAPVSAPIGLAIDPAAGRLYWANNGFPNGFVTQISYARLDGSGGGALGAGGAPAGANDHPEMLALLKAPDGTGAPAITGGSAVGSTLSCSRGSWAGDLLSAFLYQAPHSYAYQWSRNGAEITGATSASLTATLAGDYACQVTAANQAGSASQTSAAHTVTEQPASIIEQPAPGSPVLSALRLSPRSFHALARGPSVTNSKVNGGTTKHGTTVSYRLSTAASVKFTVQRVLAGRKVGKKCVAPTRKNREKRRCARYRNLPGSFEVTGRAGANSFRFSGRTGGRRLKPNKYRLIATPTANRLAGKPRKATFKILRPAQRK